MNSLKYVSNIHSSAHVNNILLNSRLLNKSVTHAIIDDNIDTTFLYNRTLIAIDVIDIIYYNIFLWYLWCLYGILVYFSLGVSIF